jgi:hypothetical protein
MAIHPIIQCFLFFGTLLSGSINTVSKKIQYQSCAAGLDSCPGDYYVCDISEIPTNHPFNKPWLQTAVMFLAEMMCLPFYFLFNCCSKNGKNVEISNTSQKSSFRYQLKLKAIFLVLALLDLLGSTLASIGLMFITSSIYQLFRGSIVIFTGAWSVLFLKRKLGLYFLY